MEHDHRDRAHGGGVLRSTRRRGAVVVLIGATVGAAGAAAQDIERDPIRYSAATPRNVISRLQERLDNGTAKLEYEPKHGYLKSVLRALDIPESSQVLVFSKTSLQRERISPRTPRAVYFSDEVMVGYCNRGRVMEISATDEAIGTAFYTIDQAPGDKPVIKRQTESCLLCHSSSTNQGFPGHLVRSLYVDQQGNPQLANGSFRTDHTSPLAERWGGWYVTGTSGRQKHMGNMICRDSGRPETLHNADGVNVVDLKDRFKTSMYLAPHSDIVALMVLEHQAGMLNRLARAGMETRMALHYQREINKALGQPADEPSESAQSRIRSVGDDVVDYMLFGNEARLTDRITGTSSFAADFAARGPRDSKGRSLRDLDLKTRLFRYPCSYLIDSQAFDSLPREVKTYIYLRLGDILDGRAAGKDGPRLSPEDSAAIVEILRETKRDLPDDWKSPSLDSR
jgi:hypothetical protein